MGTRTESSTQGRQRQRQRPSPSECRFWLALRRVIGGWRGQMVGDATRRDEKKRRSREDTGRHGVDDWTRTAKRFVAHESAASSSKTCDDDGGLCGLCLSPASESNRIEWRRRRRRSAFAACRQPPNRSIDRCTDGPMDRWTDGRTDGRTGGAGGDWRGRATSRRRGENRIGSRSSRRYGNRNPRTLGRVAQTLGPQNMCELYTYTSIRM